MIDHISPSSGFVDEVAINKFMVKYGFSSYHDGNFWVTCCGKEIEIDGWCQGDEYEDCYWAYCPNCQTSFDWEPPDRRPLDQEAEKILKEREDFINYLWAKKNLETEERGL